MFLWFTSRNEIRANYEDGNGSRKKIFTSSKKVFALWKFIGHTIEATITRKPTTQQVQNAFAVHEMHLGCKLPFTVIIYAPEKVVDASIEISSRQRFWKDNCEGKGVGKETATQ